MAILRDLSIIQNQIDFCSGERFKTFTLNLLGMKYQELIEHLHDVKVTSRYELRQFCSNKLVRKLLSDEDVDYLDLCGSRGSLKHGVSEIFDVARPFNTTLFIIYLKREKEALFNYLAKLIKTPLDYNKARLVRRYLKNAGLDEKESMLVIEKAGYKYKDKKNREFLDGK